MHIIDLFYRPAHFMYLLYPFSLIYRLVMKLRKYAYQTKLFKTTRFEVPVIVVGNITVGGTGKTPLIIWLARMLQQYGLKPGIVSRGYGGKATHYPLSVLADTDTEFAGDEPVLIARRTGCPVVVDPKRVNAVRFLLHNSDCNIILSDDGLQHYALERDIEVAVIDGQRRFGNGMCLPVGPLREPVKRLQQVNFIINNDNINNTADLPNENLVFDKKIFASIIKLLSLDVILRLDRRIQKKDLFIKTYQMQLQPDTLINLKNPQQTLVLETLRGKQVHAVAAIGNPSRFFQTLRNVGMSVIEHSFADHYHFLASDFDFADNEMVIMTEKDAVKCKVFAKDNHWYLPVTANLDSRFKEALLQKISR